MGVDLTAGAISKLSSGDCQKMDPKPVLQVIDIRIVRTDSETTKLRYRLLLSDGSFLQQGMMVTQFNELVTSRQLQKGSVVQLTEFVCNQIRDRTIVIIIDLNVIVDKCDIIGDPIPFSCDKTRSVERSTLPLISEESRAGCDYAPEPLASKQKPLTSQTQSKKRKRQSSFNSNILAVAKEISKFSRMMMEKNREDDMGACIEKLDKLGWGTQDAMYNAAVLLFGESADYRKLWLHLKPECCGNWVRIAGSKFGLLFSSP